MMHSLTVHGHCAEQALMASPPSLLPSTLLLFKKYQQRAGEKELSRDKEKQSRPWDLRGKAVFILKGESLLSFQQLRKRPAYYILVGNLLGARLWFASVPIYGKEASQKHGQCLSVGSARSRTEMRIQL